MYHLPKKTMFLNLETSNCNGYGQKKVFKFWPTTFPSLKSGYDIFYEILEELVKHVNLELLKR